MTLHLRMDMFNIFNRSQMSDPDTNPNDTTFGKVTAQTATQIGSFRFRAEFSSESGGREHYAERRRIRRTAVNARPISMKAAVEGSGVGAGASTRATSFAPVGEATC